MNTLLPLSISRVRVFEAMALTAFAALVFGFTQMVVRLPGELASHRHKKNEPQVQRETRSSHKQ